MKDIFSKSIRALIVFTVLTGVLYPVVVTVLSQMISRDRANGSIVELNAKAVGSELLAQSFKKEKYFWSRPSTGDFATVPTGVSNFGPTNKKLAERVAATIKDLRVAPDSPDKPYDLIFTSGSGIDPHIRPESALFQADRVAHARGVSTDRVIGLVREMTEASTFGVLGRPRVNVLKLNLALDRLER